MAAVDPDPLARQIAGIKDFYQYLSTPRVIAGRDQITERLMEVDALREDWAAVIPLSAVAGEQLDVLADELLALMPYGPALYDEGVVTDESLEDRIAKSFFNERGRRSRVNTVTG